VVDHPTRSTVPSRTLGPDRQEDGRGISISFDAFRHATASEHAALYRAVMRAFAEAKERFAVTLRPADVREALAGRLDPVPEVEQVTEALDRLVGWGNLRADPDTSHVRTVEDFARRRFLYQLTREGEAAEAAFAAYDRVLTRRGELQTVALDDLAVRLRALELLAAQADPDEAETALLLGQLVAIFESLADNAQAFMASLWRTADLHEAQLDAFLGYKERLLAYLDRFIQDLVVRAAEIGGSLRRLEAADVDRLLALAARRAARSAAPGEDDDPREGRRHAEEQHLATWRARWQGLRTWFVRDGGRPAQAELLRGQARQAVPALLRAVRSHHERRTGRSDRSADFRALARWFAEAASDDDAHRIWRAAVGLSPARHLEVDAATVDQRDLDPVPATASWRDAPPVAISPRLRATGSYERRGAPAQVQDRSASRRALAATLAREAEQTAAARSVLATGRPVRLSELPHLDPREFALFLALLGDALASGRRHSHTADGSFAVVLEPTGDGVEARITTVDGVLTGPDHVLTVTPVQSPSARVGALAPAGTPG